MKIKWILFFTFLVITACTTKPKEPVEDSRSQDPRVNRAEWQIRMQRISHSFSKLLPLVANGDAFNAPENYATIENETKTLSELAHDISKRGEKVKFDADPALEFVSREFNSDMKSAYNELRKGNRGYARMVIQNTANFCITCHTRNDQGTQNVVFDVQADVSRLSAIEKANYFAATRQFDRALDEFDRALTSPQFSESNPKEWAIGLKKSLAIAIRVRRNPSLALELVSRLTDAKTIPETVKKSAPVWRTAIKEWRDSEAKEKNLSRNQKLAIAKSLVTRAQQSSYQTLSDAGLVYYLRSSMFLNDLLRNKKADKSYAEALYYSGMAAEGLQEINLWTYDEAYYEACIRYLPHSETAEKCYVRFEALQLFVSKLFGGDSVLSVESKKRLDDLRHLAAR